MNTQNLIRWGGLVTIVAAILLVIGGLSSLNERTVIGQWFSIAGSVVLVFAMMALYGAQVERSGVLGLIGFRPHRLGCDTDSHFPVCCTSPCDGGRPRKKSGPIFQLDPTWLDRSQWLCPGPHRIWHCYVSRAGASPLGRGVAGSWGSR